ncbi:MAG: DUF4279 domain-containing protein [Filimonas sp.]|nr:DUF4279 domain-containing protein [Filimonas sp.]
MKNEIHLEFCIWGFDDISHEEISKTLGIKPSKIYVKGEPVNPKFPLKKASKNGWRMRIEEDAYASFENQMDKMLDVIEQKKALFEIFCSKYYCEFSCALFIRYNNGESTPWIHLTSRYNELVKKLNIEFDFDIYCLPKESL